MCQHLKNEHFLDWHNERNPSDDVEFEEATQRCSALAEMHALLYAVKILSQKRRVLFKPPSRYAR